MQADVFDDRRATQQIPNLRSTRAVEMADKFGIEEHRSERWLSRTHLKGASGQAVPDWRKHHSDVNATRLHNVACTPTQGSWPKKYKSKQLQFSYANPRDVRT